MTGIATLRFASLTAAVAIAVAFYTNIAHNTMDLLMERNLDVVKEVKGNNDVTNVALLDGLEYPDSLKPFASKQLFLGGGPRVKLSLKIYSVGLYLDQGGVASLKKKYKSSNIDESFYESITKMTNAKTLLLRFHRNVGAQKIIDALQEALLPKIDDEMIIKDFTSLLFNVVGNKVQKHSSLYLMCKGETLTVSKTSDIKKSKKLKAKNLCPALFSVFMGDSPVSEVAKKNFAAGFVARS